MQNTSDITIKELAKGCKSIGDNQDKLKDIFKGTIQAALEAEIGESLGYSKHDPSGNNSGNSRNGHTTKTLKSRMGKTEITVPRDRNSEFEPQIIKKYQTTANELEDQVLAMYAKGMSTRDIEDQMREIYGVDVSPALVSKITDKIMPQIAE